MTALQLAITLMCAPIVHAIRNGEDSNIVSAMIDSKIAEHTTNAIHASEYRLYMYEHIRNILAL